MGNILAIFRFKKVAAKDLIILAMYGIVWLPDKYAWYTAYK